MFDRGNIIAESDGSGTLTSRNIRGYTLLAQKDEKGRLSYYLHDAHGDITSMIDASGKVLNSYQYDAFGNTMISAETIANRFRYAGEQFDPITGQYYLRARYYDPQVGRFTQEDTYRGDGLNLYAYVGNNPVNFIDPSGHAHVRGDGVSGGGKCSKRTSNSAQGLIGNVDEFLKSTWNNISEFFSGVDNSLTDIERKQYQEDINKTKKLWKEHEEFLKKNPDSTCILYGYVSEDDPNYEEAVRKSVDFNRQLQRMCYISCGGLTLDLTSFPPPNLINKAAEEADEIAEKTSKSLNPSEVANKIANSERTGSGLKGDTYHRAASYLSESQISKGTVYDLGKDNILLQVEGSVNGKEGVFEYILNKSGQVVHQLFKEGGIINGIPN